MCLCKCPTHLDFDPRLCDLACPLFVLERGEEEGSCFCAAGFDPPPPPPPPMEGECDPQSEADRGFEKDSEEGGTRSLPDATAAAASAPRRELGSVVVFLTTSTEEDLNTSSREFALRLGTESLCLLRIAIFGGDFCLDDDAPVLKLRRNNEFLFSDHRGDSVSKSPSPSLSTSSSSVSRSSWLLEPLSVALEVLVEEMVVRGVTECSV